MWLSFSAASAPFDAFKLGQQLTQAGCQAPTAHIRDGWSLSCAITGRRRRRAIGLTGRCGMEGDTAGVQ
jgi:hypothetical protein